MRVMANPGRSGMLTLVCVLALLIVPVPTQAQTLPPATEIVERHVAAVGGREAMGRFSSRHTVADMSAIGLTMRVEAWQARPDKTTSVTTMAGVGAIRNGYDGAVAWEVSPTGVAGILTGPQMEAAARNASFDGQAVAFDPSSMRTVARSSAQDRACWLVRVTPEAGTVADNCFDVETGLLLESRVTTAAAPGVETVIRHADYRDFDGIKIATNTVISSPGVQMVWTLISVSHAPIPASTFDLPREVQALLTAQ